jgi:hypothetical protein
MILWINLVSDGIAVLYLGLEPAEADIMRRAPRGRHENIFAAGLGQRIALRGLALGGPTFRLFPEALSAGASQAYAQTVAFATFVFAQVWLIFDARSATTLCDPGGEVPRGGATQPGRVPVGYRTSASWGSAHYDCGTRASVEGRPLIGMGSIGNQLLEI